MIYLDNAATSWPKPDIVYETLGTFLQRAGANPGRSGHRMAAEAAGTIDRARARIAKLINLGEPDRVVFTSNATDSLNMAIKGNLRAGDHVITTVMEHNSVRRPIHTMERSGVEVTRIGVNNEGIVDPDDIRSAIQANTKMIAVVHASNVNGAIQPVPEIGSIAREHGALLLVDAAQTIGAIPIDLNALGADLLAFPGHKALMGPPGTGGLIIGERVNLATFQTAREGGTGGNSEEPVQPDDLPTRYEAGTANTVGIAALEAALHIIEEIGVDRIADHERELTTQLIQGLSAHDGVNVLSPASEANRAPVVSFTIDGWEPSEAGLALDSSFEIACRTGLHCAPEACGALGTLPAGTIRFSPGYFTTTEEIDRAIDAVGQLARAAIHLTN